MRVAGETIQLAVRALRLSGHSLCVHASLRSFGQVEGGARTVVDALVAEGCTVLAPTFSTAAYELWPDPPDVIKCNGVGPDAPRGRPALSRRRYSTAAEEIDPEMGAVAAAVLAHQWRVRGDHPLNSFTAVGPAAQELVAGQRPRQVYAPLEALAATGGTVVLMGVGLERMTLLHLAERRAGRAPFIRWAKGPHGQVVRVEAGGCSEGFPGLAYALASVTTHGRVGASRWLVFPVRFAPASIALMNWDLRSG